MITSRDEQIKSAGDIIAYGCSDELKDALEMDFPELKESEDERMRKAIIKSIKQFSTEWLQSFGGASKKEMLAWLERQKEPEDKGEISDGYHTFNELYYYRLLYNAAFFNLLPKEWVHKSKKHHDGEECFGGGWFVVMANLPTGQISNHYELKDWDLFKIPEKEFADEWDGHTPQEAADRLHKYLREEQKDYNKLYEDIAKSEWFKKAYVGKSLGGEDMQKPADRPEDIHNRGYVKGVEDAYNNVGEAKVILKKLAKDKSKPAECIADTVKFDEGFKTGREVGFREGVESVKPTEWSEEDKCIYDSIICEVVKGGMSLTPAQVNWIKLLPEKFGCRTKQEWSEEDEKMLNKLIAFFHSISNVSVSEINTYILWLFEKAQSLRPQPHWKSSKDEDNEILECIITTLKEKLVVYKTKKSTPYVDAVKSILQKALNWTKEQWPLYYGWKPSDEQMKVLIKAVFGRPLKDGYENDILESLYDDLKKL